MAGSSREVLAEGAELGDRFVALVGGPRSSGWLTAGALFGSELAATLGAVGAARGTAGPAVAGQLLFEQYAQRLAAPVLAAAFRHGVVLDARPAVVRARVIDGSLRRVAFARAPAPVAGRGPASVPAVVASLLSGLEPAAAALHRHTRVGTRLLQGAMANAVASTFLHLSWPGPDRARHVDDAAAVLAAVPGWPDLVTVAAAEVEGERWMYTRRNTCCLAFRTAANRAREQPCCSACPVLPPATTRALFGRATAAYAERSAGADDRGRA